MTDNLNYKTLPFNFDRFDENDFIITNESGEYVFTQLDIIKKLANEDVLSSKIKRELESKQFITTGDYLNTLDMVTTRYRTRKSFISKFTSLHMLVLTVRCNQDCKYCQVSAESDLAYQYDMIPEVAKKAVEYAFYSPSTTIKIEFQGGEPTLNWSSLVAAVEHALFLNKSYKKQLEFVICTNLTNISDEQLVFLHEHNIKISTSLDGPKHIHDANRVKRSGEPTYDIFLRNLDKARKICGHDAVSALMTTSSSNINHLREVVDEYVKLGFGGVFIRSLNPYGFASDNQDDLGYSTTDFVSSFSNILDYIIGINLQGVNFPEYFTTLLLTRILTPFPTGFVDLQSPSGAGIAGVIYDYNGDVYPADEARMLSRMGDKSFLMGNVFTNSYQEIFNGEIIREIVSSSLVELLPGCTDCPYKVYCGADPIRNYLETSDLQGYRPSSEFCNKNKAIFKVIFNKLRSADDRILNIFWSWVTRRPLTEITLENL